MATKVKSQQRSPKTSPSRRPEKAPKATPKAARSAPKTATAARTASGAAGEDPPLPVDPALIERIRARWPAPTDVQRTAYRSQFSDEYCDEMGTKTKAELVRREALGWAVTIDTALRSPGGNTIRYSGARLRWFMEQIEALETEIQTQRAEQGTTKSVKQTAAESERSARAVLDDLQDVLRDVAGERANDKRDYDNALTTLQAPEDVAERLTSLAKLGKRWLARTDAVFQALVAEHGLGPDLVARAEQRAAALEEARTGARGTRIEPRDAPTVNRAEGRVLAEMKVALRAFESARRTDKTVRALVPGRATRGALVGRTKSSRTPPEETPPQKSLEKKTTAEDKAAPATSSSETSTPRKTPPGKAK